MEKQLAVSAAAIVSGVEVGLFRALPSAGRRQRFTWVEHRVGSASGLGLIEESGKNFSLLCNIWRKKSHI